MFRSIFDGGGDGLMLISDICMIRSNNKQMAQVEGEHMPLIMHCWHYGEWSLMMILIWLNDISCYDVVMSCLG